MGLSYNNYGSNTKIVDCFIYYPTLTQLDGLNGLIFVGDIYEISTGDNEFYIMPNIQNKYSKKIGFKITAQEYSIWKMGIVELSYFFEVPRLWFRILPQDFPLWRCLPNVKTAIQCMIEPCKKPNRLYMNHIATNAIRKE